jgi:hypothetical protein
MSRPSLWSEFLLSTNILQAVSPIHRSAIRVRDRQNENVGAIGQVNYAVRKTRQTAATDSVSEWMPNLWMTFNNAKGFERFRKERVA